MRSEVMGPAIGSAGARYTRGTRVLDIRSFGASPQADGRTNRLAIQAAVDSAAESDADHRSAVYIPSGTYNLDNSIFITGSGIDIFGDGKGASTLYGLGFPVLQLGTRKEVIGPGDNVVVDSYGVLDSSAAPSPGSKYGLDLSKYRLYDQCGPLFRNGDLPLPQMRQFTVDVVVVLGAVAAGNRSGICGWESPAVDLAGEYWFIEQERSPDGQSYRMRLWLSLEKKPPREFTMYQLTTPWSPFSEGTVVRFSLQVDLDGHGGGGGPVVVMFQNGKQVAPEGEMPKPGGKFLDNFLRIFTVGKSGREPTQPVKVYGLRAQKGLRYVNGGPGSTQAYISGGTINDQNQCFPDNYGLYGPDLLFQVAFDSRPSDLTDHPSMKVMGGSGGWEYVPLSPQGQSNEFLPFGLTVAELSDFSLSGKYFGAGMLINGTSNCQFHDIGIYWFATAISFYGFVSYSNYFNNIDLEATTSLLALRSAYLQSFRGINSLSCGPRVYMCADSSSQAAIEDWVVLPDHGTSHYVYSEGASFQLKRFWADNEGTNLQGCCEYYFDACGTMGGAFVDFEWVADGAGSYRRPVIMLGGPSSRNMGEVSQFPANFSFRSARIAGERTQPGMIQVESPMWRAKLEQDGVYDRGPFVLDNTLDGDSRVKVEDHWYNGPPRSSLWQKGMTRLHPPDVVSGRPVEYLCSGSGAYGTGTPPRWKVMKVLDDDESRLAADVVGHCYWSAGAAPSRTVFGFWSDAVQVQNMDWIFQQEAPAIPALPTGLSAKLSLTGALRSAWAGAGKSIVSGPGYSDQAVTFTFPEAGRAEASAVSFGPATGDWDDGGASSLVSSVVVTDGSGNPIASVDIDPVSVKSGDSGVSLAAGAIFMQHQPVEGSSFSPAVEDALAKAWLGGSKLPVWNLYLAVSTDEADVSSAPAEPSDPAYRRLAAPPSCWTSATGMRYHGAIRDYPGHYEEGVMQYEIAVVSNKQVMDFAKPTADWGTVRSVYLMDAATGGNVVATADLVLPRAVKAGGAAPGFEVGAIRVVRS